MKPDLAYIGHPILRKQALPVLSIDQPILELIGHMKQIVAARRGLGLAAPQVGVQLAVIIVCFPEIDPEGEMIPGRPKPLINPMVTLLPNIAAVSICCKKRFCVSRTLSGKTPIKDNPSRPLACPVERVEHPNPRMSNSSLILYESTFS